MASAAGVGLVVAGSAWASDTFYLQNNSSTTLVSQTAAVPCSTGLFASLGGTDGPGQTSSLTLDANPFSSCQPTEAGDNGGGGYALSNPELTWEFDADDPAFGAASLTCYADNYLAQYLTFSVSGLTCTVTNTPNAPTVRFVSSGGAWAPRGAIRNVMIDVPVELFSRRPTSAHVRVTLLTGMVAKRASSGAQVDVGEAELVSGHPRSIRIRLDSAVQRALADHKRRKLSVHVQRDDGRSPTSASERITLRSRVRGDDSNPLN
jgi:hypothetical protein